MFGFSWNGTLTRIAVGGTLFLLTFSFPESDFWLKLATDLARKSGDFGDPIIFGAFVCLAYAIGTTFTELIPQQSRWESVFARALAIENQDLLVILSENRVRTELYYGLSRAFALFAGLGVYNTGLRVFGVSTADQSEGLVGYNELLPGIVLGAVVSWLLARYGDSPLHVSERVISALEEGPQAHQRSDRAK